MPAWHLQAAQPHQVQNRRTTRVVVAACTSNLPPLAPATPPLPQDAINPSVWVVLNWVRKFVVFLCVVVIAIAAVVMARRGL